MKTENANILNLSYLDLIEKARKTRKSEYSKLSSLSFEKLSTVTSQTIDGITLNRPISDPIQIYKIATLIYAILKLRQDHYQKLILILDLLNTNKNEQVGIFVSFVYSKVLKHGQRGFLQQKLDICLLGLQSASNVLQTAYFLFFLAKHSPNSILLCITQFINATTKVILHKREDVRLVGYEALKLYLQILERTPSTTTQYPTFPLYIFAQKNLQKSHYEQHGAFLIFLALLEHSPDSINNQAQELMLFFINLLPKCPVDIRHLVLRNLVLLASLQTEDFKNNFFSPVSSALLNDNLKPNADNIVAFSLCDLIQLFPNLFLKEDVTKRTFIHILQNLLNDAEKAPLDAGFTLLTKIVKYYPEVIYNNSFDFSNVLLKTHICKRLIEVIPDIFFKFNFVWDRYRIFLIDNIIQNPALLETLDILNLLASCPYLNSAEVVKYLQSILTSKNDEIRCIAPQVLLVHIPFDDTVFVVETLYRLITLSLSDPSPRVRRMILKSFPNNCLKYLTTHPFLTCLETLAKDESQCVSSAAIELIGRVSKLNPFETLPTLRSLLLDSLLMLDSPRPLHIKKGTTKSLLTIINAASEILPVYCPTLCLNALRQLSFTPLCELTYFDQKYLDKINLNIIKAIGIIADKDVSLIKPHIGQFSNFFIWLLQQHGPKQIKITVVKTMYKIMSGSDSNNEIDVKVMFNALITIASKWNSRKLNVAVLKLIGLIGAIDQSSIKSDSITKRDSVIKPSDPAYPMSCACTVLISVLSDDFLVIHHQDAIKSLVNIFSYDKTATANFFNEFMLLFLDQIRKQMTPDLIQLLTRLCNEAPREWVTHYTNELLELIRDLWKTPNMVLTLDLIPTLASVFADRFSSFLPECISFMLDTLFSYSTTNPQVCHRVFAMILSLNNISKDFYFLIYPEIIEIAIKPQTLMDVRIDSLLTLKVFVQQTNCIPYSAALIRCILESIKTHEPKIQGIALMILYSLVIKLGSLFSFYAEQVVYTLQENNILTAHFVDIIRRVNSNDKTSNSSKIFTFEDFPFIDTENPFTIVTEKMELNQNRQHLSDTEIQSYLIFQDEETPWNWKEWYRSIVKILIENSPSPAINSCSFLCDVLFNTAENLFNTAFFTVWVKLSNDTQLYISASLTRALLSDAISGAIRTSIVNLFDFMERSEHPIPISKQVLCQASEKCSQLAKALYFVHRWYDEDPNNIEAIETLIRLSTNLGLKKTIIGISKHLNETGIMDFNTNPKWSEQLGQWSAALEAYKKMPLTPNSLIGIMRCLKNLQRWDEIISKIPEFESLPANAKRSTASIIAKALFHRQQWDKLPKVLEYCTHESVRVLIITALYQISQNKKEEALQTITDGYNLLAQNVRGVIKHDKAALYPLLVKAQQLQEISETANETMNLDIWEKRLSLCKRRYNVYHQILSVHLTVFSVNQILKDCIKVTKLALKTNDFQLFDSSLNFLFPDRQNWPIEVSFIHAKGTWARGNRREALAEAKEILRKYKTDDKSLKAKIFFHCGQWIISMTPPDKVNDVIQNAIKFLEQSIMQDTQYYRAWHRWAWASSVIYNNNKSDIKSALNAINGFLQCVRLKNENSLSELLQMISLFFSAELSDELFLATGEHIAGLSDSVLLKIIPQLFTQLSNDGTRSSGFASQLAEKLLPEHFHSVLYPLIFLSHSKNNTVIELLESFGEENPSAVEQSIIVSDGLLLCSFSTLECYCDVIVKAVRFLQKMKISKAQQVIMKFLMDPPRPGDTSQINEAKNELQSLCNALTQKVSKLNQANNRQNLIPMDSDQTIDVNVYKRRQYGSIQLLINQFIKALQSLYGKYHPAAIAPRTISMHNTAPSLAMLKNSILAVPGTYSIGSPIINIFQFDPTLDIFNSKMRPRLVSVYGSDGIPHRSLLKGREDLRMDQRMMQFFELINQHIISDFSNDSIAVHITTYSIVPLSPQAGLIQFVDGTDTLFSLISEYRNTHNVHVFAEQEVMEDETTKNIDNLLPIQRLEALRFAAGECKDTDLRELMWLNAPSSREWVSRTTQFTQSSALMSIVGYIIGLGDRHPSNLMIHRETGAIIHIDFGDCFEVGKNRVKFPEKVPFRLTRLMKRAFGPTGIDGEFRLTCEETIKLVRSHKESIMAVLDIFLQEPLENDDEDGNTKSKKNRMKFRTKSRESLDANHDEEETYEYEEEQHHNYDLDNEMAPFEDEEVHKQGSIEESLSRIMQKIIGTDFDPKVELTIDQQVDCLIHDAEDMYNLANLYHGWTPLW